MPNSTVVGGAGEHYVAYVLSCFGYLPAMLRDGSPIADLLVSSSNARKAIAIQVKTTEYAKRTRGRGSNKKLHHLEFPLGHKAIERAVPELIFCFVDLDTLNPERKPDVYVIPADVFIRHYASKDVKEYKWLRLHWGVEKMEQYKNNWSPVHAALSD